MRQAAGRVAQIRSVGGGGILTGIDCPERLRPAPGQYILAYPLVPANDPIGLDASLAVPLFEAGPPQSAAAPEASSESLFWTLAPPGWQPGTELRLRGPLGKSFQPPPNLHKAVLVALADQLQRLLPLARKLLQRDFSVAVYSDAAVPDNLPSDVEMYPLKELTEALHWAEFLALDLRLEDLILLRETIVFPDPEALVCPAQALVIAPMPCGGLADCGVCAVRGKRGWKLTCAAGPVFDLNDLAW